jgi:hypothetical protein
MSKYYLAIHTDPKLSAIVARYTAKQRSLFDHHEDLKALVAAVKNGEPRHEELAKSLSAVKALLPKEEGPPRDVDKYLNADKYYQDQWAHHQATRNSSRTEPSTFQQPPVGTWKIDSLNGYRGHSIDQLRMVPVQDLKISEEDYSLPNAPNPAGKKDDAERYAEWMKTNGIKDLPPLHVLETDEGSLKISDGHRRFSAAKMAGVTHLPAWVSPRMYTGLRQPDGKPIYTALTHEGYHGLPVEQPGTTTHSPKMRHAIHEAHASMGDEKPFKLENAPPAPPKIESTATGKQPKLFGTKGNPRDRNLFDAPGVPEDAVYKPPKQ